MKKLLVLIVLLCPALVYAQECPKHLFYIDKSDNKNVLYYDAVIKNGELSSNPVDIYWILAKNNKRDTLTMLEKPQFGIKTRTVTKGKEYIVNVRNDALASRDIKVSLDENGCAVATSKVGGKEAVLNRIFVQISPDSGILPDVEYLEIFGTATDGGKVTDRVLP